MDNLSIAFLVFLFILSGPGLSSVGLFSMLFTGFVQANHVTIFSLVSMLTYYFYGLFGMMYMAVCSMAYIMCGMMYWFEMTFEDMRKKADEMREQTSDESNSDVSETDTPSSFDRKIQEFNEYRTAGVKTLYEKLGLTEERRKAYENMYSTYSTYFDNIVDGVVTYIARFREMTNEIAGLKTVYYIYDQLVEYKKLLESIRAMHKISRTMTGFMPSPKDSRTTNTSNARDPIPALGSLGRQGGFGGLGGLGGLDGLMNDVDMADMQRQFSQMSDAEKKQMDDMARQMFGNMNLNDLAGVFGGLGSLGGNPPHKSSRNQSRKRR